jgi:hypothetical protein
MLAARLSSTRAILNLKRGRRGPVNNQGANGQSSPSVGAVHVGDDHIDLRLRDVELPHFLVRR